LIVIGMQDDGIKRYWRDEPANSVRYGCFGLLGISWI